MGRLQRTGVATGAALVALAGGSVTVHAGVGDTDNGTHSLPANFGPGSSFNTVNNFGANNASSFSNATHNLVTDGTSSHDNTVTLALGASFNRFTNEAGASFDVITAQNGSSFNVVDQTPGSTSNFTSFDNLSRFNSVTVSNAHSQSMFDGSSFNTVVQNGGVFDGNSASFTGGSNYNSLTLGTATGDPGDEHAFFTNGSSFNRVSLLGDPATFGSNQAFLSNAQFNAITVNGVSNLVSITNGSHDTVVIGPSSGGTQSVDNQVFITGSFDTVTLTGSVARVVTIAGNFVTCTSTGCT